MASLSGRAREQQQQRQQQRQEVERSISAEAELISLRRKAESWGANENEESISSFTGRWEAFSNWFPAKARALR